MDDFIYFCVVNDNFLFPYAEEGPYLAKGLVSSLSIIFNEKIRKAQKC